MNKLWSYYLTRLLLAGIFGAFFVITGTPWWGGALVTLSLGALFVWAVHSGRYVVQPDGGVAPLRRDEQGQAIAAQSARNAFVVCALAIGAIIVYSGIVGVTQVPVALLNVVLTAAVITYFVSDVLLRTR
jgi:hypothetical protein